MYQPLFISSYAFSPDVTMLLQDQLSLPNGRGGGSGNRALAGFQCTISPNAVMDGELEWNFLPVTASTQHAFDVGVTVQI